MKKSLVLTILLLSVVSLAGCDARKLHREPLSGFRGDWIIRGNGFYDGVMIRIAGNKDDQLKGTIIGLNDNKFVRFFCDSGSVLINRISRVSNTEFTLSEHKVGKALFDAYGLETSTEFYAEFTDRNTIGLAGNRNHKGTYATRLERVITAD